jgi:hypothetical protein
MPRRTNGQFPSTSGHHVRSNSVALPLAEVVV